MFSTSEIKIATALITVATAKLLGKPPVWIVRKDLKTHFLLFPIKERVFQKASINYYDFVGVEGQDKRKRRENNKGANVLLAITERLQRGEHVALYPEGKGNSYIRPDILGGYSRSFIALLRQLRSIKSYQFLPVSVYCKGNRFIANVHEPQLAEGRAVDTATKLMITIAQGLPKELHGPYQSFDNTNSATTGK